MEPTRIYKKLQNHDDDAVILKQLIQFAIPQNAQLDSNHLEEWELNLSCILEIICAHDHVGNERFLLSSHAFFSLLTELRTEEELTQIVIDSLKTNQSHINFSDKEYKIVNRELFNLSMIYGYLQANKRQLYNKDTLKITFDIIYKHCIAYTKYSYFAYKVLYLWLRRIMNTPHWDTNDMHYETKMEAIIFSNWYNTIHEISKQNSSLIFNTYMKIMVDKYDGYLDFLFHHCVRNISWYNEIKYVILAEICSLWVNIHDTTTESFILGLCTSLTKNYLHHAGTKVYMMVLKNLSSTDWQNLIGSVIRSVIEHWEGNGQRDPIQAFCKFWLEPTVSKYKNILPYMWQLSETSGSMLFQSHLQRMASERHVFLPRRLDVTKYINHKDEDIRLNGYAAYCSQLSFFGEIDREYPFIVLKRFLWYNANTTSVYIRKGIVNYFKIFYPSLLKICDTNEDYAKKVGDITLWLYKYFLDCFDVGACYQQKILGLSLYQVMLSFNRECIHVESVRNTQQNYCPKCGWYGMLIHKHLKISDNWLFTDRMYLLTLFRLVLDTAADVSELAKDTILRYFDYRDLTEIDQNDLINTAWKYCNSSKFYEVESGATLMTLLAKWCPTAVDNISKEHIGERPYERTTSTDCPYVAVLFNEACYQLKCLQEDLLKATVNNRPFYGVLTALSKIAFRHGPESSSLSQYFIMKILNLLQFAVDYLLSVLSLKSDKREFSSSFQEMGLSIDQMIKGSKIDVDLSRDELSLSPAHQIVVSCIWMSLKISCEIACEIGMKMYNDETTCMAIDMIAKVLMKCRHKGAIEAAGVAIHNLSGHLCNTEKYCDLPKKYLNKLLNSKTMENVNITRRGAGLSIMFHKIVTSDTRKGMPLLHYAIHELLDILQEIPKPHTRDVERYYDLPFARYLHFLSTLMSDKKINAPLVQYTERIALICIKHVQSGVWPIKNACLRLCGAIAPKIVGPFIGKKEPDFGTGYSVYHFITHYPSLSSFMLMELEKFTLDVSPRDSHGYTILIQILTLLSKLSVTGCDLIDGSSHDFILSVKSHVVVFLGNPIWHVRYLSAKSYAAFTTPSAICVTIKSLKSDIVAMKDANQTHGHLLAIQFLKEKHSVEVASVEVDVDDIPMEKPIPLESNEETLSRIKYIINEWKKTDIEKPIKCVHYIVQGLILQLSEVDKQHLAKLPEDPAVPYIALTYEKNRPGFFLFLEALMSLYAQHFNLNTISTRHESNTLYNMPLLSNVLNTPSADQASFFLYRLSSFPEYFKYIIERCVKVLDRMDQTLLDSLISYATKSKLYSMWRYPEDSRKPRMTTVIEDLKVPTDREDVVFLRRFLVLMCYDGTEAKNVILSRLVRLVDHKEEFVRRRVAQCIKCVFDYEHSHICNIFLLHSTLILLKDESWEIRRMIAESVQKFIDRNVAKFAPTDKTVPVHEEILYQNLISDLATCHRVSEDTNIIEIVYFLKKFPKDRGSEASGSIESPFDHENDTSSREISRFLTILFHCFKTQRQTLFSGYDNDTSRALEMKDSILIRMETDLEVKDIVHINENQFLLKKREIVADSCYCDLTSII